MLATPLSPALLKSCSLVIFPKWKWPCFISLLRNAGQGECIKVVGVQVDDIFGWMFLVSLYHLDTSRMKEFHINLEHTPQWHRHWNRNDYRFQKEAMIHPVFVWKIWKVSKVIPQSFGASIFLQQFENRSHPGGHKTWGLKGYPLRYPHWYLQNKRLRATKFTGLHDIKPLEKMIEHQTFEGCVSVFKMMMLKLAMLVFREGRSLF